MFLEPVRQGEDDVEPGEITPTGNISNVVHPEFAMLHQANGDVQKFMDWLGTMYVASGEGVLKNSPESQPVFVGVWFLQDMHSYKLLLDFLKSALSLVCTLMLRPGSPSTRTRAFRASHFTDQCGVVRTCACVSLQMTSESNGGWLASHQLRSWETRTTARN